MAADSGDEATQVTSTRKYVYRNPTFRVSDAEKETTKLQNTTWKDLETEPEIVFFKSCRLYSRMVEQDYIDIGRELFLKKATKN